MIIAIFWKICSTIHPLPIQQCRILKLFGENLVGRLNISIKMAFLKKADPFLNSEHLLNNSPIETFIPKCNFNATGHESADKQCSTTYNSFNCISEITNLGNFDFAIDDLNSCWPLQETSCPLQTKRIAVENDMSAKKPKVVVEFLPPIESDLERTHSSVSIKPIEAVPFDPLFQPEDQEFKEYHELQNLQLWEETSLDGERIMRYDNESQPSSVFNTNQVFHTYTSGRKQNKCANNSKSKKVSRSKVNGVCQKKVICKVLANNESKLLKLRKDTLKKDNRGRVLCLLDFKIVPGRGMKLQDIDHIASEIQKTPVELLPIFHYVLFDIYGNCKNKTLTTMTRQNILDFSGFPTELNSENLQLKKNRLLRVPFTKLCDIASALLDKSYGTRAELIEKLLLFLQVPTRAEQNGSKSKTKPKKCEKACNSIQMSEDDYFRLKYNILSGKGPSLIVKVERLKDVNTTPLKAEHNSMPIEYPKSTEEESSALYIKPAYILKGPGTALQYFPEVKLQVQKATEGIIKLLHQVMYGTTERDELSRLNILEFSGFSSCQMNFVSHRSLFLSHLDFDILKKICWIFSLCIKDCSKSEVVQKIIEFLHSPSTGIMQPKGEPSLQSSEPQVLQSDLSGKTLSEIKLRDFENITSNIECTPPELLSELNDLLYVKPSDSSSIHQQILDFQSFPFNENSMEYHFRKTLLHYMEFDAVKRIAQLLEIPQWENHHNQDELSSAILKFLIELKQSRKPSMKKMSIKKSIPMDIVYQKKELVTKLDQNEENGKMKGSNEKCVISATASDPSDHLYCANTGKEDLNNLNLKESSNQREESEIQLEHNSNLDLVICDASMNHAQELLHKEMS